MKTAAPLPYEFAAWNRSGGLTIAVGGSPTIDQLVSTLHVFGIEAGTMAQGTILLDLRRLQTAYSREDLMRVGLEIACSYAHVRQFALLVEAHRVTGVSERAARRAGLNMRVFDSEEMALAWLQLARVLPAQRPRESIGLQPASRAGLALRTL